MLTRHVSTRLLLSDISRRALSSSSTALGQHQQHTDRLLVVGSGVAGCAAALVTAEHYRIPVTLMFAGHVPTDCNSYWAQGGIIYRNYQPESGDSAASLVADIQRAGAGLCNDDAVWKVATQGPERVRQLLLNDESSAYCQVPFTRNSETDDYALCLEASHAAPRILFDADHTGKTITECLTQAVAEHPLITLQPHTVVTDLIVSPQDNHCLGVATLHRTTGVTRMEYAQRGTVLCSGGLAGIYQHSTNPAGFNALGSSVALASRVGAATQDLEFVQFHPTALHMPGQASFLLSEALRGEGAILRNADGQAFASQYHPDAELAPRDIVARAVFTESQTTGATYLDMTHTTQDFCNQRFPSIQGQLQRYNLSLARDWIPILPAAHYTCGGVVTDEHGATSIANLYAAGEAARTGLHGGNRLASTSLLEGLVYGASVADHVGNGNERAQEWLHTAKEYMTDDTKLQDAVWSSSPSSSSLAASSSHSPPSRQNRFRLEPHHIETAGYTAMALLQKLRKCMWDYVGVVRTPSGLDKALEELSAIRQEVDELHTTCPTLETAAVRDAAYAGYAVTEAASRNKTSVGAHCIVEEAEEESDEEENNQALL
jgi:L-aspartate oxidase